MPSRGPEGAAGHAFVLIAAGIQVLLTGIPGRCGGTSTGSIGSVNKQAKTKRTMGLGRRSTNPLCARRLVGSRLSVVQQQGFSAPHDWLQMLAL